MKHLVLYEAHSNMSKRERNNWILKSFIENLLDFMNEKGFSGLVTDKVVNNPEDEEQSKIFNLYYINIVWPQKVDDSSERLAQPPSVTLSLYFNKHTSSEVLIKLYRLNTSATYQYTQYILDNFNNEEKPFTDLFLRSIIRDIKWIIMDYFASFMFRHLLIMYTKKSSTDKVYNDKNSYIKFMKHNEPKFYAIALDDIYHRYLNKPSLLSTKMAEIRKKIPENNCGYARISRLTDKQRELMPQIILQETWFTAEVLGHLKKLECETCELYNEAIKIKFSENKLNEIKQKAPDVFDDIKAFRAIEDQWKTDLSADMGDLGF